MEEAEKQRMRVHLSFLLCYEAFPKAKFQALREGKTAIWGFSNRNI